MSGRLVHEVFEYAPESLTRLEVLVLLAIAEVARDGDRSTRGGAAAASVIAHRVRSTPGSVRNALASLQDRALIKPLNQRACRGTAQQYQLAHLTEFHRTL